MSIPVSCSSIQIYGSPGMGAAMLAFAIRVSGVARAAPAANTVANETTIVLAAAENRIECLTFEYIVVLLFG
jgi:hypothetical protein